MQIPSFIKLTELAGRCEIPYQTFLLKHGQKTPVGKTKAFSFTNAEKKKIALMLFKMGLEMATCVKDINAYLNGLGEAINQNELNAVSPPLNISEAEIAIPKDYTFYKGPLKIDGKTYQLVTEGQTVVSGYKVYDKATGNRRPDLEQTPDVEGVDVGLSYVGYVLPNTENDKVLFYNPIS